MAENFEVGQVLYTRDGRLIGNAIIVDFADTKTSFGKLITIRTDFGNFALFTVEEIMSKFYISDNVQSLDERKLAQMELLNKEPNLESIVAAT